MAITAREVKTVVDAWEAAGARVEAAGSGWKVFPPNGSRPYPMHTTISDRNAHKAMRAWGRRNGLPWPGEYNDSTNSRALENPVSNSIPIPPYILEGGLEGIRSRVADVLGATYVVQANGLPVEVKHLHNVLREHGRGFNSSANASTVISKVLFHTGWRPIATRRIGKGSTLTWGFDPSVEVDPSLDSIEYTRFPDLDVHTAVDDEPTTEPGPDMEVDVAGIEALRGGPVDLEKAFAEAPPEPLTVSDPQVIVADDEDVAEQLLREAETTIQEFRDTLRERDLQLAEERQLGNRRAGALLRTAQERDEAKAEIERLQAALARERSAPASVPDGSWLVPLQGFIPPSGTAAVIDPTVYDAAGLTVSLHFRRTTPNEGA